MAETEVIGASDSSGRKIGAEPVFFGKMPEILTQSAVDGITFDFNDGLRVRFPEGARQYRVRFVDLDNKFTVYDTLTPENTGGGNSWQL